MIADNIALHMDSNQTLSWWELSYYEMLILYYFKVTIDIQKLKFTAFPCPFSV